MRYLQPSLSIMHYLTGFIYWQNHFQRTVGHLVAWGGLTLVCLVGLSVLLRYGFDFSHAKLDETLIYNHALLFMLGVAYTYQQNQHVRVDLLYSHMSPRQQTWINLVGAVLFVMPTMAFILWSGWDYVAASWAVEERSVDPAGLGYVYLLKTVILISAGLVLLQSLSLIAQYSLQLFKPEALPEQVTTERFYDSDSAGV